MRQLLRIQPQVLGRRIVVLCRFGQKLPPAQPPWILYATVLMVIGIGCWMAMMVSLERPAGGVSIAFELAAADDDLAGLRSEWLRTCDAGLTPAERFDLALAARIARTQGHADILNQLHEWGIHGVEDPCDIDDACAGGPADSLSEDALR